jgi:hypothetical protein
MKQWLTRLAVTLAVTVGLVTGLSSAAQAGDTYALLSDRDGRQVAHMVHVDDGDVFKIYDDYSDGHGPTGYLQFWNPAILGWDTIESEHNGAGDGNPVSFQYNVIEGVSYRMRICHAIAGCANQPFKE